MILPIIKHITKIIKLVNTIDEPIGRFIIKQDNNIPITKDAILYITENIITLLYVLNICLDDSVGNIINEVINKAPITFIPITTVNEVRIDIITLIILVFKPVDLENVSSNVTEKILLYKRIKVIITIIAIIILNITSTNDTPSKEPYK